VEKKSRVDTTNEDEVVYLETFGRVVSFFGPLVTNSSLSFLEKIRETLRKPWFHGDISSEESNTRLFGKPIGTYLIRFSLNGLGTFTLSRVSNSGSIVHQRFSFDIDMQKFIFKNNEYESIDDFLIKEKEELFLLEPCLGSRFQSLFFLQEKVNEYVGGIYIEEDDRGKNNNNNS